MKVVGLSALRTDRLYPPGVIPGTYFWWRLSRPQGHSAAGRIMSMKSSSDTIGNRTSDLPVCSAEPQPTTPPRAPPPPVTANGNFSESVNDRCYTSPHRTVWLYKGTVFWHLNIHKYYFRCYTVHVVKSLNYYTNHCTYIKFIKFILVQWLV